MSKFKKFKVIYKCVDEFNNRLTCSEVIDARYADEACKLVLSFNDDAQIEDCYEVVKHPILNKVVYFDMPDGLTYGLSVEFIARNRAKYYAHEFNNDVAESLRQDTIPLFESDYEIKDWALNNMNWSDVQHDVVVVKKQNQQFDMQDGWLSAEFNIE